MTTEQIEELQLRNARLEADLIRKNREIEIEGALEKVRSRAMAMKNSGELAELVRAVFKELTKLDFALTRCIINILDEETYSGRWWMANIEDDQTPASYFIKYNELSYFKMAFKAWKERDTKWEYALKGQEKLILDNYLFSETELKTLPPEVQAGMKSSESLVISAAYGNFGCLHVASLEPLSAENRDILARFGQVFDLTYTRFNDLKRAEAQTRESQIQLGLERVRAKAMAMQTSEGLNELIGTVFSELTKLDFVLTRCLIMIFDPETDASRWWMANSETPAEPMNYLVQNHKNPAYDAYLNAWKERNLKFRYTLKGKVKRDWDNFLFVDTELSQLPVPVIEGMKAPEQVLLSASFNNFGCLTLVTIEPLSDEHSDIMLRFAKVFDMCYARFNDLQQAEAQAREAKIEAALERVRSRSMAMQKSDELKEVIRIVYEQMVHLNIPVEHAGFIVDYKETDDIMHIWLADEHEVPAEVTIPYFDSPHWNSFREAKKTGADLFANRLDFEEKNKFYKGLFELVPGVTDEAKAFYLSCPGLAGSTVLLDSVALYIENFSGTPYTDDENATLIRFGKVFQQTYTRFLDLQKAEAQAREAQIELSLERVRASAMAMHKTDQLLDAAELLYRELTGLGIKSMAVTYSIMAMDEKSAAYYSINPVDGKLNPVPFDLSHTETEVMRAILSGWKKQEAFSKLVLDEEATLKHQTYIAGKVQAHFAAHNFDHPFSVEAFLEVSPKKAVIYAFNFAQGYIFIIGSEHLTKSQEEMVMRFTKAFEMTYRRFLDLKQAEEQAREAQVEAALERVRSKSLAMYHTSEIQLVIHSVHEELLKLSISIFGGSFIAINKDITDKLYVWGSGGTADTATEILVPDFNMTFCTNLINGIKQGWGFFTEEFSQQEKIEYFTQLFKHEPWSAIPLEEQKAVLEGEGNYTRSVAVSNYTSIFIVNHNGRKFTDDENDILKRFSKVFEQSYTRFLDLQKAEEQARESQIQLALERVRARTMAMQHSEELVEVIQLVFDQLQQLNFDIDVANFALNYKETDDLDLLLAVPHGKYPMKIHVPYIQHPVFDRFNQAKKKEGLLVDTLSKEEKDSFFEHFFKYVPGVPEENKSSIFSRPGFVRSSALMKNTALTIHNYDGIPYSEAENHILMRFGQVFDQTYTRFNDLKQAEDQAREAQIQLALERVRARTMAMQKSEELAETVFILFQQFKELGENPDQATIGIINEKEHVIEYWVTMYGSQTNKVYKFSIDEPNVTRKIYDAWKHKKTSLVIDLSGKELHDFASYRERMGGARLNKGEKRRIINVAFFSKGLINVQSTEERSEESLKLLERFAGVFEGTYTRFLDLQQAEAQARESQIQLGLERVRAAAMAMHNSQDVGNATALMFSELYKLDITTIRCGICIIDNTTQQMEVWSANSSADGKVNRGAGRLDMNAHPLWLYLLDAWRQKKSSFSYKLAGKELADYYKVIKNAPNYDAQKNIQRDDAPGANQYCSCFLFNEGCLFTFTDAPFSPEISRVLEKFAAVFGHTYRRYLDLTRAEAQAREAQIEAALERVRSKTMAMHNSADVGETVTLMFNELIRLGIDRMARCGIAIPDDNRIIELWTAKLSKDEKEEIIIGHIDTATHPMLGLLYETWKNKQPAFEYILEGDDLVNYMTALNNSTGYPIKYDMKSWGGKQHHNDFFFAEGMVFAVTSQPLSVEAAAIFKRFAGVFGQTYRRYLDLKRAEEQAREAQIEAALERVRAKAMAMRSSDDMNATANTVFVELRKLGVDLVRCGVGLLEKESHISTIHAATNTTEGASLELLGKLNLEKHPVLVSIYKHWRQNEDFFPVLEGKSLKEYYKRLREDGIPVPELKSGEKQYGYFFQFPDGCLYAWSGKQENETTLKTLKRFTSVIGLTYTRYIELQKAEINAKDAIKQASLDRVRAEIASMRKQSDLERITPLIWDELTILGIPFIRCGVFIMDEERKLIHTFLSTPDGKAIGAFHVPFDTSENFKKMVGNWRHKIPYIDHWKEEAFSQFADTLVKQGAIASKAQYMKTLPHEGVHLNFLPFLQGMLYVGNSEPLAQDNIDLIQAVAEAFSTAYARYEDFNKLEAAKQQVDNALTQLKTTQNKLIQSEKMASLGELTAGIAHEIQNPLNFVNNFSEVSVELIGEMDEELDKGDLEEAKAIAADIKENLQKIRHHGGRADGIVKGMLQHSRASSNVKEPTDINKLADEYLHLAYHGLRAKDKSFNADLVTNLDKKLPKANVVPQDIGRVILNMINNAFYATQQKAKTNSNGYRPGVVITTCAEDGQVVIKVKDNGSGIPDSIKDKIMQPFFTTKPTGEGTGLGLSLSYDIVVKGHGGSINVESIEGKGSEFVVMLPVS